MIEVVFASGNPNKHQEMVQLVNGWTGRGGAEYTGPLNMRPNLHEPANVQRERGLQVPPVPEEIYHTYFQNAQLKADAFGQWAGMASLADDSGLEVFALDGAPGVHSAYFAGPTASHTDNCEKLLLELKGVGDRRASFRCLLCLRLAPFEYLVAEGTLEGYIAREPRGESGWGYEPLFVIPEFDQTISELKDEGIAFSSHRAEAMKNLQRLCERFR